MVRIRQIYHDLVGQIGIGRESPGIAGRGYHAVVGSADRAGRCRTFIGARQPVKRTLEGGIFLGRVFPIESGGGYPEDCTRIEWAAKSTARALSSSRVYTLKNGLLGFTMFV